MNTSYRILFTFLLLAVASLGRSEDEYARAFLSKDSRLENRHWLESRLSGRILETEGGDDEDGDHLDDGDHEEDGDHHSEDEDHEQHEANEVLKEKPWGAVIIAALLINLVSLAGLLIVVAGFVTKKWYMNNGAEDHSNQFQWKFTHNMIPSFACGALIATSVFLIIPESVEMIAGHVENILEEDGDHDGHRFLEDEHEEHADTDAPVAWRFGAAFTCGFLLPIVSSLIFPHYHEPELCEQCEADLNEGDTSKEEITDLTARNKEVDHSHRQCSDHSHDEDCNSDNQEANKPSKVANQVSDTTENINSANGNCDCHHCHDSDHDPEQVKGHEEGFETDQSIDTTPKEINWSLASSVLIGDFFHNFSDGVLLGTAFSLCHRELAVTIAVATVYHEFAQEVADFFLLTKHCHLSIPLAIVLNFVGGLSVMLGAVLIFSFDITTLATGIILAIGAGVYMYVAAAECLPRARSAQKTVADKLIALVSFTVGVVPIGVVLLNHGHCEG